MAMTRFNGDWEGWLDFFLDGVATIADEAVASGRDLFALVAADRSRVLARAGTSSWRCGFWNSYRATRS